MGMTMTERHVGDVTLLALHGRLVLDDGDEQLRGRMNELVAQARLKIVLDLEDVTYIDSSGLGVMVAKFVSVRRKGGDVKLLHLTPRSYRIMDITGLLGVFQAFESETDAVSSFSHGH